MRPTELTENCFAVLNMLNSVELFGTLTRSRDSSVLNNDMTSKLFDHLFVLFLIWGHSSLDRVPNREGLKVTGGGLSRDRKSPSHQSQSTEGNPNY